MQSFMVKVVVSDERAAQLQDFGAELKASVEDVLCAAVHVGLTDIEAVEGELIVGRPGWANTTEEHPGVAGKQRFTATLELEHREAAQVIETAEWDDVSLTEFLSMCLEGGLFHAYDAMKREQAKLAKTAPPQFKPSGKINPDGSIDDDIPF